MFRHKPARLASLAVLTAVTVSTLPAAPAVAGEEGGAPHLDAVERTLRQVSPGLEGDVWQRTDGNRLDDSGGRSGDWLLQTPGCWGDDRCAERPGSERLLERMRENIAGARHTVDISTLAPFPNGRFQEAVVAGLKAATGKGNRLKVRVLVGAAPVYHLNVLPSVYRDELWRELGKEAAGRVELNVASMTTSKTAFSWNHSKLLVVDGRSAVTGGINGWKDDYLDTAHPVTDLDMALTGPAAGTAGRYLDRLWGWTCRNKGNVASVWYAASRGTGCMAKLAGEAGSGAGARSGAIPVLAVGGLGVGIEKRDEKSVFRPRVPEASDTRCGVGLHDNTNADRDYDTVNPEESALRTLVESAKKSVLISQQDLNATCPPIARYDVRLYDALAARLAAGVNVRIVVSDPANRGAVGSGGYSQIRSLSELAEALRGRLERITGDGASARRAMNGHLQLASFRSSDAPRWADGHPYPLHHKLLLVDDSTFYIGSKNLYPSWLQDFGYLVESPAAAARLEKDLLEPEWRWSRATALFDYERGIGVN
ncbi:phospholipase D-like domain-containing protein [Streptomyces orinoci]|uniref:Phospholipase D-like domain-containing protein n=1 Tax=Streptomyces orinoci TaxID=67339 RepID=A0ABV3JR63_STRON|nr:phospholipase D-like domain-containing protein [Streptomyces orinoci]